MCISCNCLKPNLKHGPASITLDDIIAAAKEHGIDPLDTYQNLLNGFDVFYSLLLTEDDDERAEKAKQMTEGAAKLSKDLLDKNYGLPADYIAELQKTQK